jgi:hypothetical protein
MHLAFHMGTTYNRPAPPGEQGQMGHTTQSTHVFDFNHTKIVFSSAMIGIKPITIKEHCFQILIPGKPVLDYVFNDPIVLRFVTVCIKGSRSNTYISCGC